jgi:hypothetical protein
VPNVRDAELDALNDGRNCSRARRTSTSSSAAELRDCSSATFFSCAMRSASRSVIVTVSPAAAALGWRTTTAAVPARRPARICDHGERQHAAASGTAIV